MKLSLHKAPVDRLKVDLAVAVVDPDLHVRELGFHFRHADQLGVRQLDHVVERIDLGAQAVEEFGRDADADVARWMADAGFEAVECKPFPPPMPHRIVIGVKP